MRRKNANFIQIIPVLVIVAFLGVAVLIVGQKTGFINRAHDIVPISWGSAASFNNSYLVADNSNNLTNLSVVTLEAWIKMSSGGTIFAMQSPLTSQNWQFGINGGYLQLYNPYWYQGHWAPETVKSSAMVTSNLWQHVAVVFNKGSVSFYIGGKLAGTANTTNKFLGYTNSTTSPKLVIGGFCNGGSQYSCTSQLYDGFSGQIDDARISSYVEYAGDWYPVPDRPFTPDFATESLWHFDSNDGTTTPDSSGKSRNAYIHNVFFVPSTLPVPPLTNNPPVPAFTASPSSGYSPLTVLLTNQSTDQDGDKLTYQWYFLGDMSSSTETNPTHVFTNLGNTLMDTTILLQVTDQHGAGASTFQDVRVFPNHPPHASFATPDTSGREPFSVSFNNTSTDPDNDPLTYLWDFGDGSKSTDTSPSHIFKVTKPGLDKQAFTITLTATDSHGAIGTANTTITVLANHLPVAKFSWAPYQSCKFGPCVIDTYKIVFTNTSADPDNDPLTYLWNFGDGQTSTDKNPTHAYSKTTTRQKTYQVTLTVWDDHEGQGQKTSSITVGP